VHDIVIAGVPLRAILAGVLFNRFDVSALKTHRRNFKTEFTNQIRDLHIGKSFDQQDARLGRQDARLDRMQADISSFVAESSLHEVRIEAPERQKQL
jgi:hypothetical protein